MHIQMHMINTFNIPPPDASNDRERSKSTESRREDVPPRASVANDI